MSARKICPYCGHENLDRAKYCFQCGRPLEQGAGPAAEADNPESVFRRDQRVEQAMWSPEEARADDQVEEPVTCLTCGAFNRPTARFCVNCGAPLIVPDRKTHLIAHASARTDIGRVRENNEDSVGLWALQGVLLALVADGMGGEVAGEEASRLTVEAVQADFVGQGQTSSELLMLAEEVIMEKLASAIQAANLAVIDRVDENTALRGMGTTATLAFIRGRKALVAHVGDSRAYLVDGEDGWISQITSDHSFVEALLSAGHITEAEARDHPMKNVLYRALGQTPDTTADLYDRELKAGDRIVLCSDGLTRHVSPHEIAELVLQDDNPEAATQRLIDLANERGGEDNISAIVVLMESVPDTSDSVPPPIPTTAGDDEVTIAVVQPGDQEDTLIEPVPTEPGDSEVTLTEAPADRDAILREGLDDDTIPVRRWQPGVDTQEIPRVRPEEDEDTALDDEENEADTLHLRDPDDLSR